ncbi:MAG: Mitochondrial distribution and morphology protein 12 [Vezdaea acicularis]|nr:MAG: Mitochondrial distribution and morphology protein 12 [Vezdaea acicularis]
MSIDIDWEKLTRGPDGAALAETVRDFIDNKFQQIALPRFIRSVQVHAFEFGDAAPEVELKDICDPLPDFYEDDGATEEDEDEGEEEEDDTTTARGQDSLEGRILGGGPEVEPKAKTQNTMNAFGQPILSRPPSYIDTRLGLRSTLSAVDGIVSPLMRASTPSITGGPPSLSYFHSPLATGLPGAQTPLSALAVSQAPRSQPDQLDGQESQAPTNRSTESASSLSPASTTGSNSRPATGYSRQGEGHDGNPTVSHQEEHTGSPRRFRERRPEDMQVVSHVRYSGDVKLSLTAEILLDYPMPSFVGIPLRLNITGLSFDGVAVLAYIRKRAHFCFLSPEDALTLVDADGGGEDDQAGGQGARKRKSAEGLGGLLHEIKVESEIGQKENGKQVLKNLGKVEKFVLEQVRKIFEDEFVYPSFWTFLL